MSHVDEGALHAYLDGALDEYPTAVARRVREHLETCAVCGARLEDERRVREQARVILGHATPDVAGPAFEELRAHASATQPGRTTLSVRIYRLGWAASVVLALGTGWLLRGDRPAQIMSGADGASGSTIGVEEATPAGVATQRAEAGRTPAPGLDAERDARLTASGAPASPESKPEGAGPTSEPASSVIAPAPAGVNALADAAGTMQRDDDAPVAAGQVVSAAGDAPVVASTLEAQVREPEMPVLEPLTVAPVTGTGPDKVVGRQTEPSADDSSARERDAESARRSAQGQVLTSAISAGPTVGPERASSDASVERPKDEDADAGSLVVPGLELIAVLPVSEGRTFAGMRALQRLQDGDTLEVIHLAQTVAPSTLPPVREGSHEIVLERGEGWVVLRGPRTEAELLALLQRLEAAR